jgi:putative transposase
MCSAVPLRTGQAQQNAYIESFNGQFRDECLNEHWFTSLQHARVVVETWRKEYNERDQRDPLAD